MVGFCEVFDDVTKQGTKIPSNLYLKEGTYPIIDQGQADIAGYANTKEGLFTDVPAIIFGDHTRIIKYVDTPCFLGADGVKLLKAKDKNANYKYLYYALCNVHIPNTGYSRHFKWLKEVEIPEYSAEKQKRIVEKLEKIDDLISLRKQQLAKLDELVKARFVEMFGDPVHNDKGWPLVSIGNIAEIRIGPFGTMLHKEDYIEGGHALVNPSHIIDGKICVDPFLTVSNKKYSELSSYALQIGDVVLGRRGEMGRCAVVYEKGLLCGTGSMIIRPREEMKPYFLQSILSNPAYKKIIEDSAVGVTMMNLNIPIVSALQIPQLPTVLQNRFIRFMGNVDEQKLTIQQSLDKLDVLKKSLMQEYFG